MLTEDEIEVLRQNAKEKGAYLRAVFEHIIAGDRQRRMPAVRRSYSTGRGTKAIISNVTGGGHERSAPESKNC
jgi:hypothetical protein